MVIQKIYFYQEKREVMTREEQLKAILPYVDTVTFQHMDENVVRELLSKR